MRIPLVVLLSAALSSSNASAGPEHDRGHGHGKHGQHQMMHGKMMPGKMMRGHHDKIKIDGREGKQCHSTCAYRKAMEEMHHQMDKPYTGDIDVDFAVHMVPHHQGAIDMAKVELQYGKDPWVRRFAGWIINAQEAEIGLMNSWLYGRMQDVPEANTPEVEAYKKGMHKMHQAMDVEYSGDADVDFVRGMIPHHQGAVDMAEVELRSGKNQVMHKLASDIIRSQQQEISMMQDWLDKHAPTATHSSIQAKTGHSH